MIRIFLTNLCLLLSVYLFGQDVFLVSKSTISFTSDAPLELIEAESSKMQGALKISNRSFAFRSPMSTFEGFNSSLQKVHFNSNYLETSKYPNTIFEGKIIEEVDFSKPGTYNVRGKGRLTCHGVVQERIIKCKLTVASNTIKINSEFTVLLEDHNIKIPSVVNQKIAEEILVSFTAVLKQK